jgi:hypothetical protein
MMRLLKEVSPGGTAVAVLYEVALRAIGQDLASLLIESLEIKLEEKTFVAQGRHLRAPNNKPEPRKGIFRRSAPPPSNEPMLEPFARKYTVTEIHRLDALGKTRQTSGAKTPDPSSLVEALRTIGRAVDAKAGRLVQITRGERTITFVYEDASGSHTEELYSLSLYKSQQEALALRGKIKKGDIWEDSK